MRRIASVWLIDWPITVWSHTAGRSPPPDGAAFAMVERGPRGARLRAVNAAARARGLRRGQAHADARAIVPDLIGMPADPPAEREAIGRLARWCERWSPNVAMDMPDDGISDGLEGLLIDISGGAHLFGGEEALLAAMLRAFSRARVRARIASAETPGAAWAVARHGGARITAVPAGGLRKAIDILPIAALRVGAEAERLAHRFGLKRIGDLHSLPRAKLARRFRSADGLALVRQLDRLLGLEPEPLVPHRTPPPYRAHEIYAEPLLDMAGIAARLPSLAATLGQTLEADGLGAKALTLAGFRTDGLTSALSVRISQPTRRFDIWERLLREAGIDRIDPGFGIDALLLSADVVDVLAPGQEALDGDAGRAAVSLPELIDRLSARLGTSAVLALRPQASWLPERAESWVPAQQASIVPPPIAPTGKRPLLLFERPEPIEATALVPHGAPVNFRWRRVSRRVRLAEGPERIAPEWWRPESRQRVRDYYRVEDDAGTRYWLFREGLYGQAEEAPRWWIHGLFA